MILTEFIGGVKLFELQPRSDDRGFFTETFNRVDFTAATRVWVDWVQDCRFFSKKGALRGPHFYPRSLNQYKMIECIDGHVFDLALCVDRSSPHYGEHVCVDLTGEDDLQFLVPPGFAHAVLALEDSVVQYKTNVTNRAEVQRAVAWDDPAIKDVWPLTPSIFSGEKTFLMSEVSFND